MMFALPLILALSSQDALAKKSEDDGPWMWGAGPTLGTIVYPGRFPAQLHDNADTIPKVKNDVQIGGHGVMYLDGDNRLGTHVGFGLGPGFSSISWTLEYERILMRGGGIHLFAGGGGGFGSYTFREDGVGKLKVPTYELRGQAGAMYKQKQTAEELSIYLKVPFNGVATFTDESDVETESKGGTMLHLGMEFTMYFGDFRAKKNK